MALLSVGQVNDRAAQLLDDPNHNRFSQAYILNHIDQQNESMMVTLNRMGVQQEEATALLPALPANTKDLSPYFAVGQPLQNFMRPVRIMWKLAGQPDLEYAESFPVKELPDVDQSNIGCPNYTWRGGYLQVVPSSESVDLRIDYLGLTATITDENGAIMEGIGFILAEMVACYICAMNNGMGTLAAKLQKDLARDKRGLQNLLVMQQQQQNIYPRSVRRAVRGSISSGGNALS